MTIFDDARQAGFSDGEIADWANAQRDDWRAAGFTDQEIDTTITGLKQPRSIPQSFLSRFGVSGIGGDAAIEGFKAGFGDAPLGLSSQDEAKLSDLGIFHQPGQTPSFLQVANEAVIRPSYVAAQVLFRGLNGIVTSVGADLGNEIALTTGANEAETARARRDVAGMVQTAALLAGAVAPVGRAGPAAGRAVAGVDELVGDLPRAQDFTDAARVVTDGEVPAAVREKIVELYEDHGIHPAEVAHDAQIDPGVARALNAGELPERYVAKAEPVPEPEPVVARPTEPAVAPEAAPPPLPEFASAAEQSPDGIPTARIMAAARGEDVLKGPYVDDGSFTPRSGGFGAPAETPAAAPYFTYDDRPAVQKAFSAAVEGYKTTFQPELISDRALTADPLFARYKSMQAMSRDSVIARAEEHYQAWRKVPEEERLAYIDRLERGLEQPEQFQALADRHRTILAEAFAMEKEAGSQAGYVTDYFPHIWLDPQMARDFVAARVAQIGPKWFQKERTFDFVKEGMEQGLRLKSTNPEDLVTLRLLASADMQQRVGLLGGLQDMGLATKAAGAPGDLVRAGWAAINAPDMTQWLIAPDVQPLWKNAVEAKGLWANEGAVGTAFRGWMAIKAVWVPIKLALSAFHPLHVAHINAFAEYPAIAWKQMTGGDFAGAAKTLGEGITNTFTASPGVTTGGAAGAVAGGVAAGPVGAVAGGYLGTVAGGIAEKAATFAGVRDAVRHPGREARAAWLLPEGERTPSQQIAVTLMNEGGFVPQIAEDMKIAGRRSLEKAIDNSQWIRAVPLALREAIKHLQAPIFEEWIPNLKAAAYLNEAQAHLTKYPELLDNAEQRGVALRTLAKSVDSRYGEMFYGTVFWNRTLKDTGIGAFLSLGWNLGFAREFGGALLQPELQLARRMAGRETVSQASIRQAQNKLSFVTSYVVGGMILNGMMTYLMSGNMPQGLDYFLARIGGKNPDGTDRRVTNMTYLREIPMLMKHVQESGLVTGTLEMIYNKMMIQPVVEMIRNRDYYGNDIWDDHGPIYLRAQQVMSHIFGEQLAPMSLSGARRQLSMGGGEREVALSLLGFGPAPSYAEKSATQNQISHLYGRHVAPYARPAEMGEQSKVRGDIRNEILIAKQRGDKAAMQAASEKWMKAGGSRQGLSNIILGIPSDVSMFRALPESDQKAIMTDASPEEQQRYRPFLKHNTTSRVADMVVDAQKAKNAGDFATAASIEQQMHSTIQEAVRAGHITNAAAFTRSVGEHVVARKAPELSAILSLPKRMRGQYSSASK